MMIVGVLVQRLGNVWHVCFSLDFKEPFSFGKIWLHGKFGSLNASSALILGVEVKSMGFK